MYDVCFPFPILHWAHSHQKIICVSEKQIRINLPGFDRKSHRTANSEKVLVKCPTVLLIFRLQGHLALTTSTGNAAMRCLHQNIIPIYQQSGESEKKCMKNWSWKGINHKIFHIWSMWNIRHEHKNKENI